MVSTHGQQEWEASQQLAQAQPAAGNHLGLYGGSMEPALHISMRQCHQEPARLQAPGSLYSSASAGGDVAPPLQPLVPGDVEGSGKTLGTQRRILDTARPHLRQHHGSMAGSLRLSFGAPLALLCSALVICFGLFTTYSEEFATDEHVNQYYMWYIHVSIMIFVGFGYLMTFLRRYSYSAVALNWLTSAVVMLEFILVGGAVQQLWHVEEGDWELERIQLDLPLLIDAAFCAAAGMITFGAVIGRLTPTQITLLLVLEVPLYAVNQKLVFDIIKGLDIGGSMSIHVFGAFYGLAASMVLSKPGSGSSHHKNNASYNSDMTAMIGTLFLFIFWPSFNGALASNPDLVDLPVQTQFYCVTNTIISLLGAVCVTFATSSILEGKLDMVHIQNATLAGGVAMGAAADLKIMPGGALAIGMIAGLLSTSGYVYVTPFLEKRIGLRDTCGVLDLHGMPGILGGLAAALASAVAYPANSALLDMTHGSRC